MGIVNKSNILNWTIERINEAPPNSGVYVLRSVPSLNGILYIGCSENIKKSLTLHITNNNIPEAVWFDWYQTDSFPEAQSIQKQWVTKYTPKYNDAG
jgi:excinuclease UvrABC nuclease subunit